MSPVCGDADNSGSLDWIAETRCRRCLFENFEERRHPQERKAAQVPRRGGSRGKTLPGETPLAQGPAWNWPRKTAAYGSRSAPPPSTMRRWLAGDAITPWQH